MHQWIARQIATGLLYQIAAPDEEAACQALARTLGIDVEDISNVDIDLFQVVLLAEGEAVLLRRD